MVSCLMDVPNSMNRSCLSFKGWCEGKSSQLTPTWSTRSERIGEDGFSNLPVLLMDTSISVFLVCFSSLSIL